MIKINRQLLDNLSEKARLAKKKRINHNFHPGNDAVLQRLLNALEPGTYVRPHKHENPDKNEVFIVLRGRILVVEYEDDGTIDDYVILDHTTENYATEIPPRRYHSMLSLENGTIAYEFKEGPYHPEIDKIFAPWSPEEGSPEVENFLNMILEATLTQ